MTNQTILLLKRIIYSWEFNFDLLLRTPDENMILKLFWVEHIRESCLKK